MFIKRAFDIFMSALAIIVVFVPAMIISASIVVDSRGGVFYRQVRVGKNKKNFKILKFRTMYSDSDKKGLLTVGSCDSRITKVGHFLRKTKLDELPQFVNIFLGQMSFVGPRPEVPKYVDLYNEEQLKVLFVRPGLTDYASLKYINENEVLAKYDDAEKAYVDVVMPEKLKLNIQYIDEMSVVTDVKIILKTILSILSWK